MKKPISPFYFCLFCSFIIYCFNKAQAQDNSLQHKNYVKVEFIPIGISADLSNKGSGTDRYLLGGRQDLAYSGVLRITHLFSKKIGWYAGLKMDFIKEEKSPYYNASFENEVGEFISKLFFGGYLPATIIDLGAVYRIEKNKWDIHPRIGFGYGFFIQDLESDKQNKLEDGSTIRNVYEQKSGSAVVNVGLTANYFFTKKSFVSLNTGFRQPLNKSYGQYSTFVDDVLIDDRMYKSSSLGRDFSLSVGYGFIIGKRI